MTKAKNTPAPVLEAIDASTPEGRVKRIAAAKSEAAALKAYEREQKGDRPATPNLDAMNAAYDPQSGRAAKTRARKPRADKPARTITTPGLRWYHDGKPMPDSQNKLSSVAWYYTKGVGHADSPRLSSGEFKALLAKSGIADPGAEFTLKLSNGITISTMILAATARPVPIEIPAAAPAATTKAARKTPAPKSPAKTAAAPAKRQVTPLPKSTPKKATPKPAAKSTAKAATPARRTRKAAA